MKKILISLVFFLFLFIVFGEKSMAERGGYLYPYTCDTDSYYDDYLCYETSYDTLRVNKDGYFLTDVEEFSYENGIKSVIDNLILGNLLDYYGNKDLEIENFYDESEDSSESLYLTIEDLYYFDQNIITGYYETTEVCEGFGPWEECFEETNFVETGNFSNGYEYFLVNFENIIDQLHDGLPWGEKNDNLGDYIPSLINGLDYSSSYETYYLSLKNVCTADGNLEGVENCDNTQIRNYSINSSSPINFITGDVTENRDFRKENFVVYDGFKVSSYNVKANEDIYLENFGFQDYLDTSGEETEYQYKIYYRYDGEGEPSISQEANISEETIYIDKDFNIRSETLVQEVVDKIFEITVIDQRLKKFRISVNEGFIPTKNGEVYLYLYAKNNNTGEEVNVTKVNSLPIKVLPNDNIAGGEAFADMPTFSISENNSSGYNHETSFSISIKLEDPFGNPHYDFIDGYDISFSAGTDNEVVMAEAGNEYYYRDLSGVKSTNNSPYYINLRIKIPEPGNTYSFTGFDITAKQKKDDSSYISPVSTSTLKNVVPNQILDSNGQPVEIFIKPTSNVDFSIQRCTAGKIRFTAKCRFDRGGSGCWENRGPTMSVGGRTIRRYITFASESDNGKTGTLVSTDRAYNTVGYNYGMNHIDQTAPGISISKGNSVLSDSSYSYKANSDSFNVNFTESTAGGSSCVSRVNYQVKLNGNNIKTGALGGNNNSYLDQTVEINDIFETSGDKNIQIIARDNYGNTTTKNISVTVYPDDVSELESTISYNSNGDKYSNDSDYYIYKITLRDQFGNPVYNKSIDNINQECDGLSSGCRTIRTNMRSYISSGFTNHNTGNDAITEYDYSGTTNNNGELNFKVRSNSPGEFFNRFRITISDWNNNYQSVGQKSYYIVSELSEQSNGFKKLFTGNIQGSKDDGQTWNDIPEFGTQMNYRIKTDSTTGFSPNISYLNFRNFIDVFDEDNSDLQDLSNISNLSSNMPSFNASINTSVDATKFGVPGIEISDGGNISTYIEYNLNGQNITAPLNSSESPSGLSPLSFVNDSEQVFIGVDVIGLLQGDGKSNFSGLQEDNFSDISMADARVDIRRNAFSQIRNMTDGSIVGDVKYVEGDYVMDSNPNYETLIVRGGNLTINSEIINSSGDKLGIIVLQDNYDVNSGYNGSGGNIYVTPEVSQINAIIYGDGGFISSNDSGNPYLTDSTQRTDNLKDQLLLRGTLFTRNTIGGAILAGGNYKLPGGTELEENQDNFNKAMIYDLNYIRRGLNNCIENNSGSCEYTGGAFIIEYDSTIQVDPPIIFGN